MLADPIEERHQVVDVRHDVGEHDHVERLAERDVLAGPVDETQPGKALACELELLAAHVHADTDGGLQCRKQLACPTPDLEHALARWDVEPVDVRDEPVVRAVASLPALRCVGERVEERLELGVRRTRRCRGHGHPGCGYARISATPNRPSGPQTSGSRRMVNGP